MISSHLFMIRIDKREFDKLLNNDADEISYVLSKLNFEGVEGDNDYYYLALDNDGALIDRWYEEYNERDDEEDDATFTRFPTGGSIRDFLALMNIVVRMVTNFCKTC